LTADEANNARVGSYDEVRSNWNWSAAADEGAGAGAREDLGWCRGHRQSVAEVPLASAVRLSK
jgi:hypothetical protein